MVQGGLSISPVKGSSVVAISFDSPSPKWAERIANGVADSYVSSNLERRYAATSYARNFLKERLEELKLKLEESEKALVAYAEEQELIGALSNMVMEVYAMESCLLRAQKAAATKGQSETQTMIDAARVFIADAAERVEHEAKRAIAAVHEGDMLTTQMAVLKRFGKRAPVDTIALRRGVAAAVRSQDRYPFENR